MPLIPVNQLDALPLQSTSQYLGGNVVIIGGTVNRYFTPDQMGVSNALCNAGDPERPTHGYFMTPWLDVTGCSKFTLAAYIHEVEIMDPPGPVPAAGLGFQFLVRVATYAVDPTGVAPDPRTGMVGAANWYQAGVLTIPSEPLVNDPLFPGPGLIGYLPLSQTAACTWQMNAGNSTGWGGTGIIKVWLDFDTSGGWQGIYSRLTLSMWATS